MSRDFFQFWAYIVVFFALILESFPFIGAFVPGGIIILLICGLLAKLGFFILWKVVAVSILAAVLIDSIGYFFGKSVSRDFFRKHSRILLIRRSTIERVGRIVHGHTGKSLIFGKINPVTRSIAPFIVGNEGVNFAKFFFYSVVGSALWIVMFVFVGYVFGNSIQMAKEAEHYILLTMLILLGGFYIYYLTRLFKKFFGKKGKE